MWGGWKEFDRKFSRRALVAQCEVSLASEKSVCGISYKSLQSSGANYQ